MTELIAHGGFPKKYPENTLAGYRAALEFSPFAIEMDVVVYPGLDNNDSNHGRLICYHPAGISSSLGTYSPETIRRQLAEGATFEFLTDVITTLGSDQKYLIDLKQPDFSTYQALLTNPAISHDLIIIGVRQFEDMQRIQDLAPDVNLLALFSNPDNFLDFARQGGSYFRLWEKDVTKQRAQAIHDAGLQVWVTPGHTATESKARTAGEVSEKTLDWFVSLMIDAVLVNDIEFARNYLSTIK